MDSLLTLPHIEALLSQRSISDMYPWNTNDDEVIDDFYKSICASISDRTGALTQIEWTHYGSGYASFVDAWFYKTTPDFSAKKLYPRGSEHKGLVVLLSRLSPYFVFMEGEKRWRAKTSSSYLPHFVMVDCLPSQGVASLASQVQPILESHGLIRAFRDSLVELLPTALDVPTILSDPPFSQFDALFYWED